MNYDIELKDISVAVHRKKLLSRIDLNIKKGEFLTVLGPNGSGKTTLVKTILGMRPPSAGKAFVCGIDTALRPAEAGKKMSYIPQGLDTDKFFPASAGDVIACAVINGWGIKNSNKKNINGAVEEMGVGHLLKQPFGTLSGGEKQKIMLAGALARDPEVIILDEPNLNLDPYAYKVLLNT
ncbi:MAG: metal ABC transporter ATP-binding protein, partial [bacterium]